MELGKYMGSRREVKKVQESVKKIPSRCRKQKMLMQQFYSEIEKD